MTGVEWNPALRAQVEDLRDRVRKFDFSPETFKIAGSLEEWLSKKRYQVDDRDRHQLQAVTLMSEFYDAAGNRDAAAKCLLPTVRFFLDDAFQWTRPQNQLEKELRRQQIWCLLAWAYNRHDESNLAEAVLALDKAKDGLEHVIDAQFSCSGTLYHTSHLQGLLYRDKGNLERAIKAFARSLRFGKVDLDENLERYSHNPRRIEREQLHFEVSQARTFAFGLAETEFLRGNLFRAEALFVAADRVLIQEQRGFPRWPKLIALYERGCRIFRTEFNSAHAADSFLDTARELEVVKRDLIQLKVHTDYIDLADAFRLLAYLRRSQAQLANEGSSYFPLRAEGGGEASKIAGDLMSRVFHQGGGPVGRLVRRIAAEALIRVDQQEAGRELEALMQASHGFVLYEVELKLLEIEHLLLRGFHQAAGKKIATLRQRSRLGTRQDIWARLLAVSCGQVGDDLLGQPDAIDLLDDGYLRAFWRNVQPHVRVGRSLLPFQMDENDESLNIDRNIEELNHALIRVAFERGRGRMKEVTALCGRGQTWWNDIHKRYGHEDWFKEVLLGCGRVTRSRQASRPRAGRHDGA